MDNSKTSTNYIKFQNGSEVWYKNEKRHREDGPAKILSHGNKEWWLDGIFIWCSEYNKNDLRNKIILSKEVHPKYPTVQVWKYITKYRMDEIYIFPGMKIKRSKK